MDASKILTTASNQYRLQSNGVAFWTPYFINSAALSPDPDNFKPGPYKGKGTPAQIQSWVKAYAARHPEITSAAEWRDALIRHAMGIDCSGYVYYLLDELLKARKLGRLWDYLFIDRNDLLRGYKDGYRMEGFTETKIMSYPPQVPLHQFCSDFSKDPRRNTNVRRLVSSAATVPVTNVADVQPGDMLFLIGQGGDHIGIVLSRKGNQLVYSDSIGLDLKGVSQYRVTITHPDAPMERQDWGANQWYVERYRFNGLHRLKPLAE